MEDDDNTRTHVVLTKGTLVSHYRIIEKIGAGGMGEVYLAEDTELDRKIALKFLPSHLCQNEDCRKRFKREAQAAAGLDHPNIAGIHEVGEYNGRPFFAMQVVEGQSLKDVIAGKDLSPEQILEIVIQVCGGLQAAHDKGVIHRDIKPSNILVDGHGRVRIVDFGLASIEGLEHLTKTGSTLGTVGYMSPEQVQGEEVDHRSDLFSLGVVLYELITKQSPFKRDSEAATLKAVCDNAPEPLARFKSGLPGGLQAVIDKALEKDPRTRYQHADGMMSDLMRLCQEASGPVVRTQAGPQRKRLRALAYWLSAMGVIAISIIAVSPRFNSKERPVIVPEFKKITYTGDAYYSAISPDGTYYAYSRIAQEGGRTVYVSDMSGGEAIEVFQSSWIQSMCWSPDGKELLIRAADDTDTSRPPAVFLIPRFGGSVRKFAIPGTPSHWDIAWLPDGDRFVSIADGSRLIYVDKITGDTVVVQVAKSFSQASLGGVSPDGRWLSIIGNPEDQEFGLWLLSADGTEIHKLGSGPFFSSCWMFSGDAVYAIEVSFNGFRMWRFNIDPSSGELKGEPIALVSGLPPTLGLSISDDGRRLLCRQFPTIINLWRVFFQPGMDPALLRREQLTFGTGWIAAPSVSPDGEHMIYSAESGGDFHLFARLIEGSDLTQLTHEGGMSSSPHWSPDGKRIAYIRWADLSTPLNWSLILMNKDGSSSRELLSLEGVAEVELDWSVDSLILINLDNRPLLLNLESGDTSSARLGSFEGELKFPHLSPDGKMIAACCRRGEGNVTYIWSFSTNDGTRRLVSDIDSRVLGWSGDSKWIYFITETYVIAKVGVESGEVDTLTTLGGIDWSFDANSIAISPDEKWAIYEDRQVKRDIYLIENFDPHVE